MARQGKLSGFAWHVEYHPESIPGYNPKRKKKKKKKKKLKKRENSNVKIDCIFMDSSNICNNVLGEYYDTICKNSRECNVYKKRLLR